MLSIVIPAYNEEKRISATVNSYKNYFKLILRNFEIIVVCDGCTDNTPSIVRKIALKNKKVRLLTFDYKLGKGGAIVRGFDSAKGDKIGFTDADEAVSPKDFHSMLKELNKFDCVIASRRVKGAIILKKQPFRRRLCSKAFNVAINSLFWLGISDTQCGAKLMHKKAYNTIKDKIKSSGFEFDAELLWRIKRAGFSILEYPISWKHTEHSKFDLRKGPKMLLSILYLRVFG